MFLNSCIVAVTIRKKQLVGGPVRSFCRQIGRGCQFSILCGRIL